LPAGGGGLAAKYALVRLSIFGLAGPNRLARFGSLRTVPRVVLTI